VIGVSFLDRPENLFAVEDDGTLVIERGYGFRVERRSGESLAAGDLVHLETRNVHRVWRLTGQRDGRGSWRGVWPD
jgi:predicted 2-oxoglutarate/Fe(II)-dependent dioxygenase YbiX